MFQCHSVLFVCSGNYYRSRFAEALFNHHAEKRDLEWQAFSRGFKPHLAARELSPDAKDALDSRGIPIHHTQSAPRKLTEEDFVEASLAVMLKRDEHRPLLEAEFPFWVDRAEYWDIHDIDVEPPSEALPKLEQKVLNLLGIIEDGHPYGSRNSLALEF